MKHHPRLVCILLSLTSYLPIRAQVVVQLAGVQHPAQCEYATAPLLDMLNTYAKFPPGWRIVIACSDIAWQALRMHADAMDTNHAFTNMKGQVTVINGAIFCSPEVGRPPQRVLAHELGHIKCNCNDEGRAEKYALSLEKNARTHCTRRRFPKEIVCASKNGLGLSP